MKQRMMGRNPYLVLRKKSPIWSFGWELSFPKG